MTVFRRARGLGPRRARAPGERKHKAAQLLAELDFMRARQTATGKEREGRVDVGVVCSEREEAGLAAVAVALRRLSGLFALRRDLAALVAAARRLLRKPARRRAAQIPRLG